LTKSPKPNAPQASKNKRQNASILEHGSVLAAST
jgi:hypothetical protein